MNNNTHNQHISAEDREKWNGISEQLNEHIEHGAHIPTPPETGNYYLGSDLKWHQIPAVSIE